jgi:two-component system response regulator HydG
MNAVERGVVLARTEYLDDQDFAMIQTPLQQPAEPSFYVDNSMPLEAVEKAAILRALESVNGNKSETARRLGITRKTLHKKLKKYGVMD